MGFCLLNNIGITARSLADAGHRVAIVDIDAHHGNGSQDAFYGDGDVLYVSFHQSPLYPGTGSAPEMGTGAGLGTTMNLPLPAGTMGDVYLRAFDELVAPALERFAPEWILVSAGFDSHRDDPLTDLGLTSGDLCDVVARILQHASPGRICMFLEGGYDLEALTHSVGASLSQALGTGYRPEDSTSGGPGNDVVDDLVRRWADGPVEQPGDDESAD
jgi:acetoin utilization deacetylase AcuC-like enzyme